MGRKTSSTEYIQPIDNAGNLINPAPGADTVLVGRGVYTLTSSTTYRFPVAGQDARIITVHLQHDAQIIITSATIKDCAMAESEISNFDTTPGAWCAESPSTAYVAKDGANTSQANGVGAASGGVGGGLLWHIADTGARRTCLEIVVGGTGGEVRVGIWGKE